MIFFPSAYYFAALTGRDLLIFDNSVIGEFCKHIVCGFPMVSEMSIAYPDLLGKNQLANMILESIWMGQNLWTSTL